MSLLVSELESLGKDGGCERAALPGKFIPPGLQKCTGAEQDARILWKWQPVLVLLRDFLKARSREGFQPLFV